MSIEANLPEAQSEMETSNSTAEVVVRRRRTISEFAALIVVLIGLGAFFTATSSYFLNYNNIINIITAAAVTGIVAAPGTLLLIGGQFDLSVGAGAAFCGTVLASLSLHNDLGFSVFVAVLAGCGIGALNAYLVNVIGINAIITTLGTQSIFRGLAQVIANGQTQPVNNFGGIGDARPIFNIPVPVFLFLAVALVFWFIGRHTVFGRSVYAIGSNPTAARLSGLRAKRTIAICFVLSGMMMALAGLILTSQLASASPTAATGLELQVVTVVILGGASLTGGRGSITGTILGLLIVGTLDDGLVLKNVSTFWQTVAQGAVLIFAVAVDRLRLRLVGS